MMYDHLNIAQKACKIRSFLTRYPAGVTPVVSDQSVAWRTLEAAT